jgi:hypothetical protein
MVGVGQQRFRKVGPRALTVLLHPTPIVLQFTDHGISEPRWASFPSLHQLEDQYRCRRPRIAIVLGQPEDTANMVEGLDHDRDLFRLEGLATNER